MKIQRNKEDDHIRYPELGRINLRHILTDELMRLPRGLLTLLAAVTNKLASRAHGHCLRTNLLAERALAWTSFIACGPSSVRVRAITFFAFNALAHVCGWDERFRTLGQKVIDAVKLGRE